MHSKFRMDWKLVSATGHRLVSRPYTLRQIYLGKLIHNTSEGSFLKMFSKQTASFECNLEACCTTFTLWTVGTKTMVVWIRSRKILNFCMLHYIYTQIKPHSIVWRFSDVDNGVLWLGITKWMCLKFKGTVCQHGSHSMLWMWDHCFTVIL